MVIAKQTTRHLDSLPLDQVQGYKKSQRTKHIPHSHMFKVFKTSSDVVSFE